ncbi:MAG TPA: 5'-3' exonuclease H3TH domain-containing protein [Polyangiaceae bacterium]|nr:5'-3' exonuclease H3TH domain-containing protein [Polyangiaceae bacterium]
MPAQDNRAEPTASVERPTGLGPILLVDTYSLVFRAHHALPAMNTQAGEPTSALYGFSTVILKLLKEQRPAALAFALDAPERTFRHEQYAPYKGTRERAPSELVAQLRKLPEFLPAFGVPVHCAPGFEADDVIATLASEFEPRGRQTLIVSGDRDLLQLVTPHTRVWFVGARGQKPTLFDQEQVLQRFGVEPAQLPMRAALVGDTSDNLPGVPGVGPGTAAKLVREFGTVEALVRGLGSVKPSRVQEALASHVQQIVLNEKLCRLVRDVPLSGAPPAAALSAQSFARLRQAFESLEFRSLVPRLDAIERITLETRAV